MPERFEIYIVYERRYINTLHFLSYPMTQQFSKSDTPSPVQGLPFGGQIQNPM